MEALTDGLRSDIGQATAAHESLYRQFNDQNEKLAAISTEVRVVKATAVATEARVAQLEKALKSNTEMLIGVLAINVALLVISLYFILHH
jgi:predicted  nucleic acid-binding Zn-ribbon protein